MSRRRTALRSIALMFVGIAVMASASAAFALNPHGAPGKHRGLGIWVTKDGKWHMNTHTTKQRHVFTGTIRVIGAQINGATGIAKLDKGDYWKLDGAKNRVTFRLTTNGKWDRINLLLKGRPERLEFSLKEDGENMKPNRISIGRKSEHPKESRFTLPGQ